MVEPVIAIHIARRRTAEAEILEIAGDDVEIRARIHSPEFDVDRFVEKVLFEGQLCQPPEIAAAPDLLRLHQRAEVRRIGDVRAEALGDVGFDGAAVVADELAQIGQRLKIQLVRARRRLVIAAGRIPRAFENAFDLELPAFVLQIGARAVPVASQSRLEIRIVGERRAARQKPRHASQKKSTQAGHDGNAKATTWSLIFGVSSGLPPALNTTYCLPL